MTKIQDTTVCSRSYKVLWWAEDSVYAGLCSDYASLSFLSPSEEEALEGIHQLVSEVEADINMSKDTVTAFETIKKAMIDDNPSEQGSYAHSWHCNIAMMCYDAIGERLPSEQAHLISNDAASRFMKLAFDVETKQE